MDKLNLTLCDWDEVYGKRICYGDIYFCPDNRHPLRLLRAGSYIESEFYERYKSLSKFLYIDLDFQSDISEKLKKQLLDYKKLFLRNDLKKLSQDIIKTTQLYPKDKFNINWAIVCFEVFNDLPSDLISSIYQHDVLIFKKSFYASSFSVYMAILEEHYSFEIFKDLYQSTFLIDLGLNSQDYDYSFSNKYLARDFEKLYVSKDKDLLENHGRLSIEKINNYQLNFNHSQFIKSIAFHHEVEKNSAKMSNPRQQEISPWEMIAFAADYLAYTKDQNEKLLQIDELMIKFQSMNSVPKNYQLIYLKSITKLNRILNLNEVAA